MQLHIFPTRLISEVQEEFNKEFPFLKLEFFKSGAYLQSEDIVSPPGMPHHRRIGDCQRAITDGIIEVNGKMKVKELERIFADQFKLNVQVFRRSGNFWLQTSMTDEWTLQNQNEHGMEISRALKIPSVKKIDNDVATG